MRNAMMAATAAMMVSGGALASIMVWVVWVLT